MGIKQYVKRIYLKKKKITFQNTWECILHQILGSKHTHHTNTRKELHVISWNPGGNQGLQSGKTNQTVRRILLICASNCSLNQEKKKKVKIRRILAQQSMCNKYHSQRVSMKKSEIVLLIPTTLTLPSKPAMAKCMGFFPHTTDSTTASQYFH